MDTKEIIAWHKREVEHQKAIADIYQAEAKRYMGIIAVMQETVSALTSEINRLKDGGSHDPS